MVPEGRASEAHGDLLDVKPIAQIAWEAPGFQGARYRRGRQRGYRVIEAMTGEWVSSPAHRALMTMRPVGSPGQT